MPVQRVFVPYHVSTLKIEFRVLTVRLHPTLERQHGCRKDSSAPTVPPRINVEVLPITGPGSQQSRVRNLVGLAWYK